MTSESPAVILYNAAGVAMAVVDGVAIPVGTDGLILMGTDAGTARRVKVNASGELSVTATIPGTVDVSDRAARVLGHVVVDSSALPAGAATEVTAASTLALLTAALNTTLSSRASEATVATLATQVTAAAIQAVLEAIRDTAGVKKITDPVTVVQTVAASLKALVDQGAPAAIANSWLMQITNGTIAAAVKATNPAEADNALVVRNLPARTSTTARTSVTVDTTVDTLLVANAARRGGSIYNDDSKDLYVAFGAGATTTDFSVKLTANGYFEVPFVCTDLITAIRASGSGAVRVTEFTA